MSEPTIADLHAEIQSLRDVVLTLLNRRVSRQELADRMGITTRTLAKRIDFGQVPRPTNGKWLLSEIVDWEKRLRS